jgi:L-fuculose-phosphate aldolase
VVHAHAPHTTTLACLRRAMPAFHSMVAIAGGDSIRCARYPTFGTRALSDSVLAALRGRKACLLANHGLVAIGEDLEDALRIAEEVETLAAQYWRALLVGRPKHLSRREMARVVKKFAQCGRLPADR